MSEVSKQVDVGRGDLDTSVVVELKSPAADEANGAFVSHSQSRSSHSIRFSVLSEMVDR